MAKLVIFERQDNLFDWRLEGNNGEEMCGSVQGYRDVNDAREGLMRTLKAMHELFVLEARMVIGVRNLGEDPE